MSLFSPHPNDNGSGVSSFDAFVSFSIHSSYIAVTVYLILYCIYFIWLLVLGPDHLADVIEEW